MFATVKLMVGGNTLSAGVRFKSTGQVYSVCPEHVGFVGDALQVIAGPHKDFDEEVYTVELLRPVPNQTVPYFNSGNGCAWEYITVHVKI